MGVKISHSTVNSHNRQYVHKLTNNNSMSWVHVLFPGLHHLLLVRTAISPPLFLATASYASVCQYCLKVGQQVAVQVRAAMSR